MLFWGHSLVSPWRRKGGKNIWCHPSSRYFSFWRDQKIFWCIISCGTFFFLHWWLIRRSTPACSLISRMVCRDGWVRSRLDSAQSFSVSRNIFPRVYQRWKFVTVPVCFVMDLSSFVSIHTGYLVVGSRSGASLAGQTHGAHDRSRFELCSLDHAVETAPVHHRRISPSLPCSKEPLDCENCLAMHYENGQFLPCAVPSSRQWSFWWHQCIRYF